MLDETGDSSVVSTLMEPHVRFDLDPGKPPEIRTIQTKEGTELEVQQAFSISIDKVASEEVLANRHWTVTGEDVDNVRMTFRKSDIGISPKTVICRRSSINVKSKPEQRGENDENKGGSMPERLAVHQLQEVLLNDDEQNAKLLADFEAPKPTVRQVTELKNKDNKTVCQNLAENIRCGARFGDPHICTTLEIIQSERGKLCNRLAKGIKCLAPLNSWFGKHGFHTCPQFAPSDARHPWNERCGACGQVRHAGTTCNMFQDVMAEGYANWKRRKNVRPIQPYIYANGFQRRTQGREVKRKRMTLKKGSVQVTLPGIPPN